MEPDTSNPAAAVNALWDELGLPGAIDVHTHFMPERVLTKVWDYFDRIGPLTGMPWPVTYRGDEPARVATLAEFGILGFTALVYPHKPDMAAWLNDWSLDFAARTPGCIPTATFYPEPDAPRYVDRAIDAGARVFKCHVQVGDFAPDDPLLDPVWARLATAGVPTVIHAGSGPAPGRFTGPEPVARVLGAHPGLVLIVAHMGLPEYREFLDLAATHPGVHLDTTMAFTAFTEAFAPFPDELRDRLADLADRICFGSDFPNIPYPYPDAVRAIVDLGFDDDWLRGVFWDNARRLFPTGEPTGVATLGSPV